MDPAVIVAVLALIGSLLSTGLVLFGGAWLARRTRGREASSTLAKYREPLAFAVYELEFRLSNILRKDFLTRYYNREADWKSEYAVENTLYLLGQYFGWTEIMRHEIQYQSFSEVREIRLIAARQEAVVRAFRSDTESLGDPFMIWRGEQRALGELMTTFENGRPRCIGYAAFRARLAEDDDFRRWFQRPRRDIGMIADRPNERIREIQRALLELVRQLDPERQRIPDDQGML